MAFKKVNKYGIVEPKINNEIKGYASVRVNYELDGENKSEVMSLYDAKKLSDKMELDLIEINAKSNPPVLKIYNYSKYLYELKKQSKEKNKNKVELKEIQLTVNISTHDLEIKAKKAEEFVTDGNKVKVILTLKRREMERKDLSEKRLLEFLVMIDKVAIPESMPKFEGNKCVVILKRRK